MIESDYVLTGSQGGIINLGLILMVRQLAKIGVEEAQKSDEGSI